MLALLAPLVLSAKIGVNVYAPHLPSMHGKVLTISSEDLTLNTLSLAAGVSPFAIG